MNFKLCLWGAFTCLGYDHPELEVLKSQRRLQGRDTCGHLFKDEVNCTPQKSFSFCWIHREPRLDV